MVSEMLIGSVGGAATYDFIKGGIGFTTLLLILLLVAFFVWLVNSNLIRDALRKVS